MPAAKPDKVTVSGPIAAAEPFVMRNATYIARGPDVHGPLLSSVSDVSLTIVTVTGGASTGAPARAANPAGEGRAAAAALPTPAAAAAEGANASIAATRAATVPLAGLRGRKR